ncbi:MAG: hypothetical protein ACYTXT_44380 [Nostoc sp.]|uniref:hypothetical protein n=1 Tax=Nostoc sp. C110 TaxID=3349876 RepID=UPI00370DD66E
MSAAKRNDPNYMQMSGDVKKDIGLKFKATCTLKQISLGEGLEQAMALWLERENKEKVV